MRGGEAVVSEAGWGWVYGWVWGGRDGGEWLEIRVRRDVLAGE